MLRGWQRKVFGQLWARGRCAAKGLLRPGHLSSGQLTQSHAMGEGAELLKGKAALTTNRFLDNRQSRENWAGEARIFEGQGHEGPS